jgi:hypothetical protein
MRLHMKILHRSRLIAMLAAVFFFAVPTLSADALDPERDLAVTFSAKHKGGSDPGHVLGTVTNRSKLLYPCVVVEFDMSTRFDMRKKGEGARPLGTLRTEVRELQGGSVSNFKEPLPFPAGIRLKAVTVCRGGSRPDAITPTTEAEPGQVTVRDHRKTVRDHRTGTGQGSKPTSTGQATARDHRETVRDHRTGTGQGSDPGQATVREHRETVRDHRAGTGQGSDPGQAMVREHREKVRDLREGTEGQGSERLVDHRLETLARASQLNPQDLETKRAYIQALIKKGRTSRDKQSKKDAYLKAAVLAKELVTAEPSTTNVALEDSVNIRIEQMRKEAAELEKQLKELEGGG